MKLLRKLDDFPDALRGGALTIGNFDGVHRGHRIIIERVKQHAEQLNAPAIVFTFDPHPVRILRPDQCPPPLTWTDRKADLLADLGVEVMIAYPTDRELLSLDYQQFFDRVVRERIQARAVIEGPNFYFGKGRQGHIAELQALCRAQQIHCEVVEPKLADGQMISSSRIRQLIQTGQVGSARQLLTQPYRIRGLVVHGAARGAPLGFPTANLDGVDTLIPALGVYAGRAQLKNRWHWAAIHIGPNPTFAEMVPKVEVHILDFDDSLYGQLLEIDFIEHLRAVQSFPTVAALRDQLLQDVATTRALARQFTP